MRRIAVAVALALALSACAPESAPDVSPGSSGQPTGWKALLIAGDDQERAFDNAVDAMADKLVDLGVPRTDIMVLKADGHGAEEATLDSLEGAFVKLRPDARDGCFVFVTSHGMPGQGLVMKRARGYLRPDELSTLIDRGCRDKPTVVVASGCFSGSFAEGAAMPAANRLILTAAQRDRPSFGCNASLRYTVFDGCILDSLQRGAAWGVVMDRARACVTAAEQRLRVPSSEPQISIGAAVGELRVFSR